MKYLRSLSLFVFAILFLPFTGQTQQSDITEVSPIRAKLMVRNGALLDKNQKNELKDIDNQLSKIGVRFSENSRNAVNDYVLFVDDVSRLKGLPESALEAAKPRRLLGVSRKLLRKVQ